MRLSRLEEGPRRPGQDRPTTVLGHEAERERLLGWGRVESRRRQALHGKADPFGRPSRHRRLRIWRAHLRIVRLEASPVKEGVQNCARLSLFKSLGSLFCNSENCADTRRGYARRRRLAHTAFASNQRRHCERSEEIQGSGGRLATPGSPRRFAPRYDDSVLAQQALVRRYKLLC